MRHVVLIAFASLLLATSGCKSHCRLLSEKLCDCTTTTTDKTNCLTTASSHEANFPPTAADEMTCEGLVDTCDCQLIDTPNGKVRCGMAVSFDAGT